MRAETGDRMPEERFRPCCRYRQSHFPDYFQARRRMCLDGGSVVVGAPRSGCAGRERNSVPFRSLIHGSKCRTPRTKCSCSSHQATRIEKTLDARSRSNPRERKKVIHFANQDFPDLLIVIQSDCGRPDSVQALRGNELAPAGDRSIRYSAY